jgi:hypothetical protein
MSKIRATKHEYLKRKTDEIASDLPAKRVNRRAHGTTNPFSTNESRFVRAAAQSAQPATLPLAPQSATQAPQAAVPAAVQTTQVLQAPVSDERQRDAEAEAPQNAIPAVADATQAQQGPARAAEEDAAKVRLSQSAVPAVVEATQQQLTSSISLLRLHVLRSQRYKRVTSSIPTGFTARYVPNGAPKQTLQPRGCHTARTILTCVDTSSPIG